MSHILFDRCDRELLSIEWVEGHSGNRYNDEADTAASSARLINSATVLQDEIDGLVQSQGLVNDLRVQALFNFVPIQPSSASISTPKVQEPIEDVRNRGLEKITDLGYVLDNLSSLFDESLIMRFGYPEERQRFMSWWLEFGQNLYEREVATAQDPTPEFEQEDEYTIAVIL